MKPLHTRVITLTYFDGAAMPEFKSEADVKNYYAAIGRAVVYGLASGLDHDTISLTNIRVDDDAVETIAVYYEALKMNQNPEIAGHRMYQGSNDQLFSEFLRKLQDQATLHPFVMGMIRNEDGTYGFHS